MISEFKSLLTADWLQLALILIIMIVMVIIKYGKFFWSMIPNPLVKSRFGTTLNNKNAKSYISAFGLTITLAETLRIDESTDFFDYLKSTLTFARQQVVAGKRLTIDMREVQHINSRAIQAITTMLIDVAQNNNVFLRVLLPKERLDAVHGALYAIAQSEKGHMEIKRLKGK